MEFELTFQSTAGENRKFAEIFFLLKVLLKGPFMPYLNSAFAKNETEQKDLQVNGCIFDVW